jgi:Flp pilus assembly protein CpaB
MQNRLKIALVVAVFFGLIASYGIYSFLRQQRQAADALRNATQNIVVASKDIPAGTMINEDFSRRVCSGEPVAQGVGNGWSVFFGNN